MVAPPRFGSISTRFALLVALIAALVFGSLLILNWQQGKILDNLLDSETRERVETLHDVEEHLQRELAAFSLSWAQRPEMSNFVVQPKAQWVRSALLPPMSSRRFNRAWIINANGETVFDSGNNGDGPIQAAPTTLAEVLRLNPKAKSGTFSHRTNDSTLEIGYAIIKTEADAKPLGLLLISRTLSNERLQELGDVLRGTVTLGSETRSTPTGLGAITAAMPLRSLDGVAVDSLVLNTSAPEFKMLLQQRDDMQFLVIVTFLVSGVIAFAFIYLLILKPVNQISSSLSKQSSAPIVDLLGRQDEIGAMATLVADSFERKRELEQLLNRRAQLGRELHDGVIQTVYAAGLNLSGAASLCRFEPDRAVDILESTRRELNNTIRELRSFIAELEPEDAQESAFDESVRSVVHLMTGPHKIDVTLKVDSQAVDSLGRTQRLQLLRIIREAVSNVVRHARASLLMVEFYRHGTEGTLVVRDNGDGFDLLRVERGHGLVNLNARAADLGGKCEVESSLGRGTTVRLTFPIRETETRRRM